MFIRFETLKEKKIIGKKITMSFTDNKTAELWHSFMPIKKEIKNILGMELYSVEVYPPNFYDNFDPTSEFEKWAAVEVTDYDPIPDSLPKLTVPEGLYAVFLHKGPASEGQRTYEYIFMEWLPNSEYTLDIRPHFAVMGEKYKHDSSDSEEEIWIPVKRK